MSYKEEIEGSEINSTTTKCNNRQELHDTNGQNNNNNDSSASECNNDSSQPQSYTHQPSHQADNPVMNSGTNENVAVITKEEWDANDEITQQSKEFDEQRYYQGYLVKKR